MLDAIRGILQQLGNLITDPIGTVTSLACTFIGFIFSALPSTPSELTLQGLALRIGNQLPFIGVGIVYSILRDFSVILGLVLVIKIYKLIPFKAS